MITPIFILLGSNQGNCMQLLEQACCELQLFGISIEKKSKVYESEPWGFSAEQNFLNQVLLVRTDLSPQELLHKTQLLEEKLGRLRSALCAGYISRTMDIDMLFYGSEKIDTPTLIVPHPRLHLRRFTLMPLAEIAPDFVHPVFGKTMRELLEECEDKSSVVIARTRNEDKAISD